MCVNDYAMVGAYQQEVNLFKNTDVLDATKETRRSNICRLANKLGRPTWSEIGYDDEDAW